MHINMSKQTTNQPNKHTNKQTSKRFGHMYLTVCDDIVNDS